MIVPTPLPRSSWQFPDPSEADPDGLVGVGADLEAATLIHAYRHGMFPMPLGAKGTIGWWSPPERGVLGLDHLRVSRSLRRSCRRYEVTIDRAFPRVIERCASLPRRGGWISPDIRDAYVRLHELGWAHSVEAWSEGRLVGGLYGVQVGGLFAGESMFHTATDASKVALVGLVAGLEAVGVSLLDVQWRTPHLATLGVREITRSEYLALLGAALRSNARPLGQLTGHQTLSQLPEYLDRIGYEPTGSNAP